MIFESTCREQAKEKGHADFSACLLSAPRHIHYWTKCLGYRKYNIYDITFRTDFFSDILFCCNYRGKTVASLVYILQALVIRSKRTPIMVSRGTWNWKKQTQDEWRSCTCCENFIDECSRVLTKEIIHQDPEKKFYDKHNDLVAILVYISVLARIDSHFL